MAVNADYNNNGWIPEENDSNVVMRIKQLSATERFGRHYPMGSDVRLIPRSAGMDVSGVLKHDAYGEDGSTHDHLVLTAKKAGEAIRIAEEDLADSHLDLLAQARLDWATSYALYFDNATLATTAAETTVNASVPYKSVYKAIRTTNSATGYTADDNYIAAASGQVTYDELSELLSLVEQDNYFEEATTVIIAHPAFRDQLRKVKDEQGTPIFVQGQGNDSENPDRLFGHRVHWTRGAKTSAVATHNPTGNPIMVVGNTQYLGVGNRSNPESKVDTSVGFLTDQVLLKMRARRGFVVTHEKAFAVLELTQ